MRHWLCLLSLILATYVCGQTVKLSDESFQKKIHNLKVDNDAENFTYAFIDQYLARATKDNLQLFESYEKTIWRPLLTKEENLAYVVLLCNKGYYLSRFSETYKAIDAYEKAWGIFNKHALTGFDITEYCLKPLANNYSMLGDYSTAGNIVKSYLFIAEKEKNTDQIISALINLAIIYHDTGKPIEAIKLLNEALTLKPVTSKQKGLIYSGLLLNHASLSDLIKARYYGKLAINQFKTLRSDDDVVQLANVYNTLATVELKSDKRDVALEYITKAKDIASIHTIAFKKRDLAKLNVSYAEILKLQKQYSEALRIYQQSLAILLPDYTPKKDVDALPKSSSLYAENAIKETLDGLADVYLNTNKSALAIACYELSFTVESLLRLMYNYEEAKLQQQIENRNRTELVLNILYDLYIKTNKRKYAECAFQFSERTKAITLKENIEDRYGKNLIENDTVIKQQKTLGYRQAAIRNEIAIEQMKQEGADVNRIHELIGEQTKITLALKNLKKAKQEKHPAQSWSDSVSINMESFHKKLASDNAIMIEYFYGKNALFVFTIHHGVVEFKKVDDIPGLKEIIIELNDLFSSPSAINNEIDHYKNLAYKLCTILRIPKDAIAANLILIPDGLLHLIPFDALLLDKNTGNKYSTFSYLVRKYGIAYQPAAFLYCNNNLTPAIKNKKSLLAMFPIFENTKQELAYSQTEADGIHEHMNGMYLYKGQATRQAFLQNADQYSILHLSTHASTGNTPEPPSITFIDSTLYLPQIYGLQINADLLVLSACETGVGLLVKGEGALSLARGFQFAGVQNIIFSLWSVNDYSTATLMINFYRNYAQTESKAEALRLAKLDYLNDKNISNGRKSPYYWAGFVYYGNLEIQPVDNYNFNVMALVLIACIAVFVIIYLNRRVNK